MLILEGFLTFSGKYSTWFLYDPAINVCKLSGIYETKLSFLGVVTITIHNVKTLSISCHVQRETMQWVSGCKAICYLIRTLSTLTVCEGMFKKSLLTLVFAICDVSAGFTLGAEAAEWSVVPSATRQQAALASWEGLYSGYKDLVRSLSVTITHGKRKKRDPEGPEVRNRELLVAAGGQNLPHTEMDGQAGKGGEAGHTSYLEVQMSFKHSAHLDFKIILKLILSCALLWDTWNLVLLLKGVALL